MKSHRERHEMIYNRHENDDGSHGIFHDGGYNFMTCQKSTFQMTFMLVCFDSVHTLDIITHILRGVVNREKLCGTNAFYTQTSCMLVRLFAGNYIYTLEIVVRILNPV